jgi:hypothetical protein
MDKVILSSCLGWVLVNCLQIHRWHPILFRKPFACDVCMAGWIALGYCWSGFYTPLYMAGAMVGSILLTKVLK